MNRSSGAARIASWYARRIGPIVMAARANARPIQWAALLSRLRITSLLRNSLAMMGVTVVTAGLGYVYWLVAAHTYSTYDVGLASALISIMTLTSTLTLFGVGSTLAQLAPRRPPGAAWSRTVNAAFAVATLGGLLGGALVALTLPQWSRQFSSVNGIALVVAVVAGVMLFNVATALDQLFIAERHANFTLARNAAFAALKIPLLLAPVFLVRVGALGIVVTWVIATGATALWAALRFVPRLGRAYQPIMRGLLHEAQRMVSSLAAQHLINLGGQAPMYLLPILVTIRLSATANAYFYTTWMVGSLFFVISVSISASLYVEESHARARPLRNVRTSVLLIAALLAPMMVAYALGGRYLLALFGANYARAGLPLLMVLIGAAVPDAITNIAVSVFRIQGRLYHAGALNCGMASVTLVAAWELLPRLGLVGAGWAWLLGETAGSLAVGVYWLIMLGAQRRQRDGNPERRPRPRLFPQLQPRAQ